MTDKKGLLLVTMEPPVAMEEEFTTWYDTEHVPQRLNVPGIETGQRFVCLSGWPRYMALYDLTRAQVMESEGYLAIASTPWTRRILAKVTGYYRAVAEQIYPGNLTINQQPLALRLVLLRFTLAQAQQESSSIEQLCTLFAQTPGLNQVRIFKVTSAQGDHFLATAEFRLPISLSDLPLQAIDGEQLHLDLINIYAPYWSR